MTIAKYDLPSNEAINLETFKIELVDFKTGSAIPSFAYTSRVQYKTGYNWEMHRRIVNEKFEKIVEIADSGKYNQLSIVYPEAVKRNPIVEKLYSFVNDFGSAPVSFGNIDEKTQEIIPVFTLTKFKSSVKKELITEISDIISPEQETDEAVGKIRITRIGDKIHRKIIDSYSKSRFSIEYAPVLIISDKTKYYLKYPLRCLFEKEDDYFVIQSEMLGIIGTGFTEDETEKSFADEFDFVYNRFTSLTDELLTNHNQLIKNILNHIVEKVEK